MDETIPVDFLRECFKHREDGKLIWRERPAHHFPDTAYRAAFNTRFSGKEAGTPNAEGYLVVSVMRRGRQRKLLAARVIWAMHNSAWPTQQIDHINRVRSDNRIDNLRDVSLAVNQANKEHANVLPGAYASGPDRFRSQISVKGRVSYLGTFPTAQEAHAAFVAASSKIADAIEATGEVFEFKAQGGAA